MKAIGLQPSTRRSGGGQGRLGARPKNTEVRVVPVILCGGSGTRLWPLSSVERPKQFHPLIGPLSTFQATVRRVESLAGAGPVMVSANVRHQPVIEEQLAAISARAELLLEPRARDSGPAIAAACAWIAARHPDAVAVFVSSDHHIADDEAFRDAVETAVTAALRGRVVTLGLKPTGPATAFGYIRPGRSFGAVQAVAAFVEKPDLAAAERYIAAGYLWNSGVFVSRPAVLLSELARHAPAVRAAADAAVAGLTVEGAINRLGAAFADAPKISIDHAVMEKTRRACVAPAGFSWSDVGAWNAVLEAAGPDDLGNSLTGDPLVIDSQGCIVRVPSGTRLAVVGLRNLAIIAGADNALLICDLSRSQAVRQAAEYFAGPAA
ncbi:MAG: sugar phosphate nucleotidyltransferase [Caulobacter sp.]|nr:sugar phosphate nucleotidyltransferase [Caulobacter sp.]